MELPGLCGLWHEWQCDVQRFCTGTRGLNVWFSSALPWTASSLSSWSGQPKQRTSIYCLRMHAFLADTLLHTWFFQAACNITSRQVMYLFATALPMYYKQLCSTEVFHIIIFMSELIFIINVSWSPHFTLWPYTIKTGPSGRMVLNTVCEYCLGDLLLPNINLLSMVMLATYSLLHVAHLNLIL